MTVTSVPVDTADNAGLSKTLFVVSAAEQATFLLSLPQVAARPELAWILPAGVAARDLGGNFTKVPKSFGSPRTMLGSVREARGLIETADVDVVIVGAGRLALAFLLAARKLGVRSVFLESPTSGGERSRSPLTRLADATVVEWEHQLTRHPFAIVLGETA